MSYESGIQSLFNDYHVSGADKGVWPPWLGPWGLGVSCHAVVYFVIPSFEQLNVL